MKRVHPNLNLAASIIAVVFLSSAAGCKNQSGAVAANPFFGPNRVPPPATRALQPGQAQPYYQGDPLPVSQSGPGPSGGSVVQAAAETEMPSADGNLAWTSPSGAITRSGVGPAPATVPPASATPSRPAIASNEPNVAVPDDGNSLRFALPEPQLAEPQSFTPTNPAALASTPASTSAQPGLQLPPPPSSRDIVQAAYTEPVITNSQAPTPSPWRTPQIAQANSALSSTTPANYYDSKQPIAEQPIGQPIAYNVPPSLPPYYSMPPAAADTMAVQLREVPSPRMPRIRIPGYETSNAVPTVGNTDGFRSRTSMR
jgi:hypothetical protein